jgi:hypothetical protein
MEEHPVRPDGEVATDAAPDPRPGPDPGEGPGDDATAPAKPLEVASRRRVDLHAGLVAMEEALAAPAPGRGRQWAEDVRSALLRLQEVFHRHVDMTGGEHGLFADVVRTSPRLHGAVARLDEEHTAIASVIVEELERLRDPGFHEDPADTRERLLDLLGRLVRHRQRGADLIYEAYSVDIGGG